MLGNNFCQMFNKSLFFAPKFKKNSFLIRKLCKEIFQQFRDKNGDKKKKNFFQQFKDEKQTFSKI